jgi:hypothetical protein
MLDFQDKSLCHSYVKRVALRKESLGLPQVRALRISFFIFACLDQVQSGFVSVGWGFHPSQ